MKGSFAGVLALVVVECRAPGEAFRTQRSHRLLEGLSSPLNASDEKLVVSGASAMD
jgi:hypothetical protein